jgi:biofilm PGA synthesis lipoprotein PgaB
MIRRLLFLCLLLVYLSQPSWLKAEDIGPDEFLVLCYHNIPLKPHPNDHYGVSHHDFVKQMEYLCTHGYNPISLKDILSAREDKKPLPKNAVLLMFDDAYRSYYTFVAPVLKEFGYPSVLPVVGSWIDSPPADVPEPLMTWDEIRKVMQSGLVEVISHTHGLHKGVQYNPQGNVGPAMTVRAFDPEQRQYETETVYRQRLIEDFRKQKALFQRQLGMVPKALAWPYGKYNEICLGIAEQEGISITFTLDEGLGRLDQLQAVNRLMVVNPVTEGTPFIREFIEQVKKAGTMRKRIRGAQVDLDLIYDSGSQERTDQNLGRLIDRLVAMGVNTVFLQAFSDFEGAGNIKSVYFANRVLPVKADIFSHAAHQLMIRDMTVYAWMPTLSIVFPDDSWNETWRVREKEEGQIRVSRSWYQRLTPFSDEVRNRVRLLYEDLAAHAQIEGILFQDDAYLTEEEDYHPLALKNYEAAFDQDVTSINFKEEHLLRKRWARYKTEVLIDFTNNLAEGVKKYRPSAKFARNLYAPLMTHPDSELWFAQNYELFLQNYDQVVVMAYERLEGVEAPMRWYKALVERARNLPAGLEKSVFKVQSYDWETEAWLEDEIIIKGIRQILAAGGQHVAYYPDNLWENKPRLDVMKLEMSTRKFPFMP